MLGKRKTAMRRTSSVSLIGSGSVNGDSSPLPDHPKEKLKPSYPSPPGSSCGSAPRQVIGFHPKVFIDEEEISSSPISPQRAASPRSRSRSSKSPSGSPRSGLGDLLAGSRPWERKEEGVGLSIVAALSGSQEEVCSEEREDGRGFSVPVGGNGGYGSRKTSPPAHGHMPSVFAPSRASPPIPIHSPHHSDSGHHSPSHCTDRNCCPTVTFGLAPPSYRRESIFIENNIHQAVNGGGGSRHNSNASNGGPWTTRPNAHNNGAAVNWSHNDMEVDRNEIHTLVHPPAHLVRQSVRPSASFVHNFLDACHLCRRPLGEGRDIYIYRGDKAFCSPECRHQQIVNDERPEKCSAAVMKVGGGSDGRSTSQRSRVMAAGTATAAAA